MPDGRGRVHRRKAGAHQISDVDELHQAAAVARHDDGAARAQAIPEIGFAIKRIVRTVNERGSQRNHRQSTARVHAEQSALAHRFIADVELGGIVGRKRVSLVMVQAVAVSRDARNENVALEIAGERPNGALDVRRGGAAFPIVDMIENDVEVFPGECRFHRLRIVAIRDDVADAASQAVLRLAMENGNLVAGLQKLGDQRPSDELRSPDDEAIHGCDDLHQSSERREKRRGFAQPLSRSIPVRDA